MITSLLVCWANNHFSFRICYMTKSMVINNKCLFYSYRCAFCSKIPLSDPVPTFYSVHLFPLGLGRHLQYERGGCKWMLIDTYIYEHKDQLAVQDCQHPTAMKDAQVSFSHLGTGRWCPEVWTTDLLPLCQGHRGAPLPQCTLLGVPQSDPGGSPGVL